MLLHLPASNTADVATIFITNMPICAATIFVADIAMFIGA
jgi:hypothetical protein